jgi:pimeloyl-ACP methyl ester carboxylesterase
MSSDNPADRGWDALGPPPVSLFAREQMRAIGDFADFGARRKLLRSAPRGDGHPVFVMPGFLAGDFSTAPLRRFLRALRYDARGWKLGINMGPDAKLHEAIVARLHGLSERHGRRVSLIGWSLGGIYAREVARAHADRVRLVITMGTPFRDISATHASRLIRPGRLALHDAAELQAALRRPLPVPATSIYSRTDGIVHWQGCLEQEGPQCENVEVECSHTGMGFHADAMAIIADRLAQPEGEWSPYRRDAAGTHARS